MIKPYNIKNRKKKEGPTEKGEKNDLQKKILAAIFQEDKELNQDRLTQRKKNPKNICGRKTRSFLMKKKISSNFQILHQENQ
jgi:hypothetical protein